MKRTSLFAICALASFALLAQTDVPKGWHMMDKATSGYYGLSVDKAYNFVKAKKIKSKTVIVAVIDSGIDTLHEDLKSICTFHSYIMYLGRFDRIYNPISFRTLLPKTTFWAWRRRSGRRRWRRCKMSSRWRSRGC